MKLTSMKLTDSDLERQKDQYAAPTPAGDRYPYGLEVRLDNDALDKLGIDELPDVGERLTLMATVKVTSCSSHDRADGGKRRSCELQIVAMGLEADGSDATAKAKKLYG